MWHFSALAMSAAVCLGLAGAFPEFAAETSSEIPSEGEPVGQRGRPIPNGRRYATVPDSAKSREQPALPQGPALARIYQHLLELRRQHVEAEIQGDDRKARKLSRRINGLERGFRYPVHAVPSTEPRVHAVGFYSSGEHQPRVRVTDSSSPIVLVLTGYSSHSWTVEANEDVQIDFVMLTGYYEQTVSGVPDGVPVFAWSYDRGTHGYAYAYGPDRSKWTKLEEFVVQKTGGLPIATALGSYYSPEKSVVIGPENSDWRLQMLERRIGFDE